MSSNRELDCDIAILGGGLGGVAAALAATEAGAKVILTEETSWIGGQVTSQAVSALDEHRYIESLPGTHSYAVFRTAIRQHYQQEYHVPDQMPVGVPLNPGNGWVSRLCFEPRVGLDVLHRMLAPHIASDRLRIILQYRPVACGGYSNHLTSVTIAKRTPSSMGIPERSEPITLSARYFLDATELGELLPLAGLPYVTGAEAYDDTHEPHACRDGAHPERVQSFTMCFFVEYCPGEKHLIRQPKGYVNNREAQPYSLILFNRQGEALPYRFFKGTDQGLLPFWTYRRVFDASLLDPRRHDIALINWNSNDYRWGNLIDQSPSRKAEILMEARALSLGFLYWLQTEVRRDDGNGCGYPELRLLTQAVGTRSGLAMAPYIRESRRIVGLCRILEQDISAEGMHHISPTNFTDSVGIGWYLIDLHPCAGDTAREYIETMYAPTRPFQIPLGALIPIGCDNLLASCKNIATTHLTNGAYRLHHTEWSIGEAAGSLAAWCWQQATTPQDIRASPSKITRFQEHLRQRGVTLEWPDITQTENQGE